MSLEPRVSGFSCAFGTAELRPANFSVGFCVPWVARASSYCAAVSKIDPSDRLEAELPATRSTKSFPTGPRS